MREQKFHLSYSPNTCVLGEVDILKSLLYFSDLYYTLQYARLHDERFLQSLCPVKIKKTNKKQFQQMILTFIITLQNRFITN